MKTPEELKATGEYYSPPYSYFDDTLLSVFNGKEPSQPHSDVYYVRYALYARTGYWFSLTEVESAMKEFRWNNKKRKRRVKEK